MAASLTFLKTQKIIQVDAPQTSLDVQDLVNQIRLYEENLLNLDYGTIVNAYGKQPLGGGAYIGITMELINDWRIAFEARSGPDTVICTVSGGNVVAVNQYGNNPIYPTAFTQITISQSSSPTLIQSSSDYAMMYMIEALRGRKSAVGSIFYWNPTTGSDSNDGISPANAVATFSKAQSLATAGAGDIVFALATASGGVTTTSEKINITKAGLKVRGAGYAFQMVPVTSGQATVAITGDSIEFEGFYVKSANGGSDNGITVTGDNVLIKDCWVNSVTGNGIEISSSARTQIDTCAIEDSDGTGIKIGNGTTNLKVRQSIISGNGADGADLAGTGLTDNIFENNLIFNNTGYGVDVGSGVTRTGVRLNHTFSGNTLGATRDLGTGTFIETPAGGASATDIADAVWDEVIAGHATAGTAGQVLKATKLKATLASLK
jgi:hypothetical protein